MKFDFRPLVIVLLAVGALTWFLFFRGEIELTEENVTELIDDSDRQFLRGNGPGICAQRAEDFTQFETTWNFAYGEPATLEDIEAKESTFERRRDSAALRNNSYSQTYSRTEYCKNLDNQAEKLRETYRRRTNLKIMVAFDETQAQYEAEYVLVAPLPEGHTYPKGATGDIYLYSRMTETGSVTLEDYEPVIKSAQVKLRRYWMYPANIPEVDRPVS